MALIYRVFSLVEIAKKTDERSGLGNKINAILFPFFFISGLIALIWYSPKASQYFLPEAASVHGKETDKLFWITIVIISFVVLVTHILLFFFPYIYQFKEKRSSYYYPHNDKIEIVWTIIPAVVMAVLVFSGWTVWADITSEAPKDAVAVEIMGKQFNWQVRYGGKDGKIGHYDFRKIDATNSMGMDFKADPSNLDDFIPREIHIPKGKPVLLKIRARDVLHSVFMPHFRVKMDAVPGMQTSFWFVPDVSTAEMRAKLNNPDFNYELACTEVCGGGHFAMRMLIVVDEPAEFEAWYNSQEPWAAKNKDYLAQIGVDMDKVASLK
jgi:cytochrome c oxidase subunit 2